MGLDTKIYWLIDRQAQCDFDFGSWCRGQFGNPEERERPPLEVATRQRLVKTEKTLCVL
jgi:hypothetical protein